jgi:hypothetical protein
MRSVACRDESSLLHPLAADSPSRARYALQGRAGRVPDPESSTGVPAGCSLLTESGLPISST